MTEGMKTNQAKMDTYKEMLAKIDAKTKATLKEVRASKEETIAELKVWCKEINDCKEPGRTEIKTAQEDVMAMNLEAIPEDVEVVAECQKVPIEEAAVKTVSTEEVVCGSALPIGRCPQMKKWTRAMVGPRRS
jgi:hypothetical protein